jgi:hypothetical protein
MATTTTNFGWDIPQSTDLVKDGATAIAALGQDIDTALIDLKGGTTGQVLAKASGTDLDFSWVAQDDSNAIQNAIVDAKGDLIAATAADTPARLAVGTNGQVLTADSTAATGLAWANASAGKVAQVLSTMKSDTFSTTSTSPVTITGLSQAITPSATSSKILVIVSLAAGVSNADGNSAFFAISGGNTSTYKGDAASSRTRTVHWVRRPGDSVGPAAENAPMTMVYLDSPNTTSAITYAATAWRDVGTAFVNQSSIDSDNASWGRSASTITVMEILA